MLKWKYLPILKWKQGERIALSMLTQAQRAGVIPVLELPAINSAQDERSVRLALPAYLVKPVQEMNKTFNSEQTIGIDVRWVAPNHPKQIKLLDTICAELARHLNCRVVPVISESALWKDAASLTDMHDFGDYILRIQTPVAQPHQVDPLIKLALASGIKKRELHIVIDLFTIVREDPAIKHAAVTPYLDEAFAAQCASVTITGGSFPVNLMGLKQGVHDIPRVEWQVWQLLKGSAEYSGLRFGDYTVSNPGPLPDLDPKQVNPSVQLRYTIDVDWRLYKAGGFKKGAKNQYQGLCNLLLGDPVYCGPPYSDGDDRYHKAAHAVIGNGNPSSWRRDATNHHLVFTGLALP